MKCRAFDYPNFHGPSEVPPKNRQGLNKDSRTTSTTPHKKLLAACFAASDLQAAMPFASAPSGTRVLVCQFYRMFASRNYQCSSVPNPLVERRPSAKC